MKAIIWYKYSYPRNSDWCVYGLFDTEDRRFTYLLGYLLEYPCGREFRVSHEWRWDD